MLGPGNNVIAVELRGVAAFNRLTSEQNREARSLSMQPGDHLGPELFGSVLVPFDDLHNCLAVGLGHRPADG